MPASALTPVTSLKTGAVLTPAAANAAGNYFTNTGEQVVEVYNGDSSSVTVTVDVTKTVNGLAVPDRTFTLTAGQRQVLGPFKPSVHNDANSRVNLSYSAVTDLVVTVITVIPDQG